MEKNLTELEPRQFSIIPQAPFYVEFYPSAEDTVGVFLVQLTRLLHVQ